MVVLSQVKVCERRRSLRHTGGMPALSVTQKRRCSSGMRLWALYKCYKRLPLPYLLTKLSLNLGSHGEFFVVKSSPNFSPPRQISEETTRSGPVHFIGRERFATVMNAEAMECAARRRCDRRRGQTGRGWARSTATRFRPISCGS